MKQELSKSTFGSIQGFEESQRMAQAFVKSDIIPTEYRGNMSNCLIAMDMAYSVRQPILTVMQNLHIIHGKPSWSSKFLISLLKSSKKFSKVQFIMIGEKGSDSRGCYVKAFDNELGEFVEGAECTIKMAKHEGWFQKKGSKWPSMSELMLQYRAGAFFSRVHAPELSVGMLTSDEMNDIPIVEDQDAIVMEVNESISDENDSEINMSK